MQLDKNSLDRYNLKDEDLQLTMGYYKPLHIPANGYFLEEGCICNHIGFVTKGLLRSYFYDDRANEITTAFFPEGSLIIPSDSFNNRVPSKEYIKACEESDLMVIDYEQQKGLYEKLPVWNLICKDLADHFGRELLERTSRFQTLSAAERYQKFCDEHPGLLQRVNLGCIASYIGIDIATLSRIRKKK
jgi:CRP-like cAMP-binding protein